MSYSKDSPFVHVAPMIATSRMIDVNDAEKHEILQSVQQAIRNQQYQKQKPVSFDPMKYVTFVGYETRGAPIPYEQFFGRKPQ
jgi:hypothetical protein